MVETCLKSDDLLDQPKGVALLDEVITTLADKDTVLYAVLYVLYPLLFDEMPCDLSSLYHKHMSLQLQQSVRA